MCVCVCAVFVFSVRAPLSPFEVRKHVYNKRRTLQELIMYGLSFDDPYHFDFD